jgi:hypothetical protein
MVGPREELAVAHVPDSRATRGANSSMNALFTLT